MTAQNHYISPKIDLKKFEIIKNFILEKGDTKTYRNFDNNNPHYAMDDFDIYLGSDIGQKNINHDPTKSDFNELVVISKSKDYDINLKLIAFRKSDLALKKSWIIKAMKEGNVYVLNKKPSENEIEKFITALNIEINK